MFDVLEKKMTVQEFLTLDTFEDGYQYELINGEIVKKQAPSPKHQNASTNLIGILRNFARERKLGKVFHAPLDVYFTEIDYYQPDIIFIKTERLHIVTNDGIEGVPDLAVEILSPSSVRHDRNRKMKVYRQTGVAEYWVVDPSNRSIEVYARHEGDFEMVDFAMGSGGVGSECLNGIWVDIEEVFE